MIGIRGNRRGLDVCEHRRLSCTNNVLKCLDCGEILPLESLTEKKAEKPEPEKKKGGKKNG